MLLNGEHNDLADAHSSVSKLITTLPCCSVLKYFKYLYFTFRREKHLNVYMERCAALGLTVNPWALSRVSLDSSRDG